VNRFLVSPFRPCGSLDLLLRANIMADDFAAKAWRDWLRMRSIEDATWLEVRLLTPLARRLGTIDPRSPLRPRLEGLAKSQWVRTQLMMRDSVSALDALKSANIDYLLVKGAAYYAEGLGTATRRIMGDVDILVLPEAVAAANDRLCETGWSSKRGYSPERLRHRAQFSICGVDYLKGEFGEVDLHFQIYYFTRRTSELEANLWKKARTARFAGRPVLVPSPEESIVIGIADGIRSGEGDWAIDVSHRVSACQIDWEETVSIAVQRGIVPSVLSGLSYLNSLGCKIPQSTLDGLHDASPTIGEYLKYWDFRLMRTSVPWKFRVAVQRLAHSLLPQEKYQYG